MQKPVLKTIDQLRQVEEYLEVFWKNGQEVVEFLNQAQPEIKCNNLLAAKGERMNVLY
jgi:hypothetical protein